jgi:hypothetical protein
VPALAGRHDVIPLAAELVVSHDDQCVRGLRAVLNRLDQVDQVPLTVLRAGVSGMLVLRAVRLDEADRRQRAGPRRRVERGLVAQMIAGMLAGARVDVAWLIPGEVIERLVVVLEQAAGVAGVRVVPATGVPRPGDALFGQLVADRPAVVGCGRIGVVDQGQHRPGLGGGRVARLDGVHRVVAAGEAGPAGARLGQRLVG